jgi:SSS family solute:Na+ symporter
LYIRLALCGVILVSYVVAVGYKKSLVYLLLSAYGAVVQFAPVVVAALYWRRATRAGAISGLVVGSLLTTVFVIWGDARPFPLHAGLYGFVVNVVVLVVVSLATRRDPGESEDRFLAVARGAG